MGWSGRQEGQSYGGGDAWTQGRGVQRQRAPGNELCTNGGMRNGGGRCDREVNCREGMVQRVERKEPTWHLWRLTLMPQFLLSPLLCATVCGPPLHYTTPLALPFLVTCPPPPSCASPTSLVVHTPPPCFHGKGIHMCHHWHVAIPRFTPLPGLRPPPLAGAPLFPCSHRRGI